MKSQSLFKAAGLIALVTIASKVLGLVRDQMIAHAYGASMVSDAYLYAFQIPSFALILLGGLGGPFHTATVSILSRLIPNHERPSELANKVLNIFLTMTGLIFTVLSIITFFAAKPIIQLIAHDASPELQAISAMHLQWMSPLVLIGGLIGILYGVANLYQQYFLPSIAPSAINVTLIAWLLLFGADNLGYALAISTMLGAVLQIAVQIPAYIKVGFRYKPELPWKTKGQSKDKVPEVSQLGHMLFPAIIGTTIGQLNVYVAMFFTSQLHPGSWTAFVMANRLIQLPIGVLTIAFLVPLFPRFNQWAAAKDMDSLKHDVHMGVRSMWLIGIPLIIMTAFLAEPAIQLLFERGKFSHHDTLLVSQLLIILSLSVLPYMLRDTLTRVFYAFQDSKTPLIAGGLSIVINIILNAVLVRQFDIDGIAYSTVIMTFWNVGMLSFLMKKHTTQLQKRQLILQSWRIVLAGLICAACGYFLSRGINIPLQNLHLSPALALLVRLAAMTFIIGTSFALGLHVLKEPLAVTVKQKLMAKFLNK